MQYTFSGFHLRSDHNQKACSDISSDPCFLSIFERLNSMQNWFGKCASASELYQLFFFYIFWQCLSPKSLGTNNMLLIFQHPQNQIRRLIKIPQAIIETFGIHEMKLWCLNKFDVHPDCLSVTFELMLGIVWMKQFCC